MKKSCGSQRTGDRRIPNVAFVVAVIGAISAMGHSISFLPFISDDAFISMRYAARLLDGKGLTWTDGPPIEGYTNLLWLLCTALGGRIGIDLILVVRILGWTCTALAAAAIAFIPFSTRRRMARPDRPFFTLVSAASLSAVLCYALSGPIAVWTIGGLEQPMVTALMAWGVLLLIGCINDSPPAWRDIRSAGVLFALLCLTRADGAVFCAGAAVGLLICGRFTRASLRTAGSFIAIPLLTTMGQLAFRIAYYGDWIPNSARVKVAFTLDRVMEGAEYVGRSLPYLGGLFGLAVVTWIVGLFQPAIRKASILTACIMIAWIAHVILVGGDIFPAHRHLSPCIALASLWIACFAGGTASRRSTGRANALLAIYAGATLWTAVGARFDPQVALAREERWEWDGEKIGLMLHTAFGKSGALLACDAAGCLPYFSQLDCIDMLGLNDAHIARQRRAEFGSGPLGHELGDGAYVLGRHPDLVIFWLPTGSVHPVFRSGIEMTRDPRFYENFRFIIFETPGADAIQSGVWVRIVGGKTGMSVTPTRIEIPGYLGATREATPAVLDGRGELAVRVGATEPATFPAIRVGIGQWRLSAQSDGVVAMTAQGASSGIARSARSGFLLFQNENPEAEIEITLTAAGGRSALIQRVILERKESAP